ncbi:hypothetical protein PV04_00465 [Phialophora macrospora]|uniref:Uncharacterized protein n=1 Tax=Phialophora macrospora TaxID=1851006 RepID=A0A0D2GIS8_9EURO|nr:hypothetical protein PV04_00465 [Phialophora macrospora]
MPQNSCSAQHYLYIPYQQQQQQRQQTCWTRGSYSINTQYVECRVQYRSKCRKSQAVPFFPRHKQSTQANHSRRHELELGVAVLVGVETNASYIMYAEEHQRPKFASKEKTPSDHSMRSFWNGSSGHRCRRNSQPGVSFG